MNFSIHRSAILAAPLIIAALALSLAASVHAADQTVPLHGSFHSAKDPDLPPLPFNPHPELEVVEVEKGVFIVDDTGIPDTPEQAAARKARQAARDRAAAIASNPLLAQAAQAAAAAAQQASFAIIIEEVSPWLHQGIQLPDGSLGTFAALVDACASNSAASVEATAQWERNRLQYALDYAAGRELSTNIDLENGSTARLFTVEDGLPAYMAGHTLNAARTISTVRLWPGGSTGLNLDGTNSTIWMWDEGLVRTSHLEFSALGRVRQIDTAPSLNYHSTGVAGVLAGLGYFGFSDTNGNYLGPLMHGMANRASVRASDYYDHLSETRNQAGTNAARLSNHSYGFRSGWEVVAPGTTLGSITTTSNTYVWFGYPPINANEDPKFGLYSTDAAEFDNTTYTNLFYLTVWSAGNDLSNAPPVGSQPVAHISYDNSFNFAWFAGVSRNADGDAGGYDTMSAIASAKNCLTVGAVYDLPNGYSTPAGVFLAPFSSCGPTDDGRLKPDVVANGVGVVMPDKDADDDWQVQDGTSMSAPSVTGTIDLLVQRRSQLHTNASPLIASTLKALIIHTADECGTNAGPDFRFGWGLVNAVTAANLIGQNASNGWKSFIKEVLLTTNSVIEFPIERTTTNAIKVTACWTDPSGTADNLGVLDSPTPKLTNDLDLRVISPSGSTNFPWILNPDLTNKSATVRSAAATTGDNTRDNVEQVYIAAPTTGTYTVRVTHKGALQNNNPQWVSIILSGNAATTKPPLVIQQIALTATNKIALRWPSVVGQRYQTEFKDSLTSGSWSNIGPEVSARLTNVVLELPYSPAQTQRFYRVRQVE